MALKHSSSSSWNKRKFQHFTVISIICANKLNNIRCKMNAGGVQFFRISANYKILWCTRKIFYNLKNFHVHDGPKE